MYVFEEKVLVFPLVDEQSRRRLYPNVDQRCSSYLLSNERQWLEETGHSTLL